MTTEPRKRVVDSPKVWTVLLTNTKYLSGLLLLDYSLKSSGTKYPLLVLYTDTLEPEAHAALDRRGIPKMRIEYLLPKISRDYNDQRFYDSWSKLQPFSLTEYERVVQLDADMLVLKNMDELMDLPLSDNIFAASHACVCNPKKVEYYPPNWVPSNCGFTHQHSDPDTAQRKGAPPTTGLGLCNGGLQVVNPSQENYDMIVAALNDPTKTDTYEFPDQSLISDIFAGRWLALPYVYNALKTLRWCHKEIWRDEEVKNVHYILSPKPWEDRSSDEPTHKWWWDMNDKRLADEKAAGLEADGF
ncbi:nucleotide-diphospho-sugar transferase [Morchella snyderi]|nr:nucleotide-diphospho-sugar transferase [Morchella snyderi]